MSQGREAGRCFQDRKKEYSQNKEVGVSQGRMHGCLKTRMQGQGGRVTHDREASGVLRQEDRKGRF